MEHWEGWKRVEPRLIKKMKGKELDPDFHLVSMV